MRRSTTAVSPIVLGLILVVLIVSVAILGYVFLFGIQQGFNTNPTGINAVITPTLYSSDAKIGISGSLINITISISNSLSNAQKGAITITNNGREMQNASFILLPSQTTTVTLHQVLNGTGVWTIKVMSHGVAAASYYFQVVNTRDEADFAVAQWRDQNTYRNITLATFILALISFIIAAASLARKRTTIIK